MGPATIKKRRLAFTSTDERRHWMNRKSAQTLGAGGTANYEPEDNYITRTLRLLFFSSLAERALQKYSKHAATMTLIKI